MAKTVKTGSKRERTRAKLIEAAAAVGGVKGFHETSLNNVALRAGVTRGAIYGNFQNREDLFLAVAKRRWEPIVPNFKPGATLMELMRSVAERLSFQMYAPTHPEMQSGIVKQNAIVYRLMAEKLTKLIPLHEMPMPPEYFIKVMHALTDGLLFIRFLTPSLITDEVIVFAFGSLAAKGDREKKNRRR